jgi:hypothetical protein
MNVALFKTNHLGDNLVFLPVVQALRRLRPAWHLTLITAPHVADLYSADVPRADLLTATPDELKLAWRRPWELVRWAARLRARRLDASLVSYDQSSVAHGLARLVGGRTRVGAAGLRIRLRGSLTHEVAPAPGWSVARWNWAIATALVTALDGGRDWPAEPPPPDLRHLSGRAPAPPPPHCPPRRLQPAPHDAGPATASPNSPRASPSTTTSSGSTPPRPAPLPPGVTPRDCPTLAALVTEIARAALFVGNNSGPMHLANAVRTPSVIISGPSSPIWDPAWHPGCTQLLRTPGLACLPCDRGTFAAYRCENSAEPLACLKRWSVTAVESACRAALARGAE